jgi:hypothetical protein
MTERTSGPTAHVLRANSGNLIYLKIAFTSVLIGAVYVYVTIGFTMSLLTTYAVVLLAFYLWSSSIRLTISGEGVKFKNGISRVQVLAVEEISEVTMGFHPYGMRKANLLVIHSRNPNKKDIRINYFLFFRRKELARALKTLLELNSQIPFNNKTVEFISDGPYSPYE